MNIKWLHSGLFARHRIVIVMWALVAEMLASPLANSHPRAGVLLGFGVLLMVLSGIGAIADRTVVHRTVIPIAIVWMIARIVEAFVNPCPYANLAPMVGVAFSCSILWAIFGHFQSQCDNPRYAIAEAFTSYLVIATAFSQLYSLLNNFVDHAFNQTIASTQGATFLYFSMVTLTSVGYGGIVPTNPYVRMVAAMESVSGIFFVAVVVARLVSSYNSKTMRRTQSSGHEAADSTRESSCECGRATSGTVLSS
jgi:Ion channel